MEKQASSVRQLQEMLAAKAKEGENVITIQRDRSHVCPVDLIDVYPERNIRPIDPKTVRDYADAMKRGDSFPAIQVKVEGNRIVVVHGYHRALAAKLAVKEGHEMAGLKVEDFKGNSADAIYLMLNSENSLSVDPVSRAEAYLKLHNQNFTNKQIADRCGKPDGSGKRTAEHVAQMLLLAQAEEAAKQLVRDGKIMATTVIELIREEKKGGPQHVEAALAMIAQAEAQGRQRAMPKDKPAARANTAAAPKLKIKEVRTHLASLSSLTPSLRAALDEHAMNSFTATETQEGESAPDVELQVSIPASKLAELVALLEKTEAPEQPEENGAGAGNDEQQDMFNASREPAEA